MSYLITKSLILFTVLIMMSGCGKSNHRTERPGVFIIGVKDDVKTLDPARQSMAFDSAIIQLICEGLTKYDDNFQCVPELAESWVQEQNGKIWIFHLKKNVKFHDGTDFDASAVKFHYERLLDPKTKSTRAGYYQMIDKIEIMDPYTVKFILKAPYAVLPERVTAGSSSIVSPDAVKKYGEDYFKHPTGTGPFKFVEWLPENRILLMKNPDYYGEVPSIDTVIIKPIKDDNTRAIELEKKTIDMTSLPVNKIDRYMSDNRFIVQEVIALNIRYIGFNTQKPPFDDVRVRQAVNHAIDKESLIKNLLKGHAVTAIGPVPYTLPDANPNLHEYVYDTVKSKQLLKESNYDFNQEISFWSYNDETMTPVVQAIKYQMEQVGIKVKINEWDRTTYWNKVDEFIPVTGPHHPRKEGVFDMYLAGWVGGENPMETMDPLFRTGSYSNNSFYDNPAVNRLLDQISQETNIEKRRQLFFEVQRIVVNDSPWIFLFHGKNNTVLWPRIQNYQIPPSGEYKLNDVTLAD